MGEPHGARARPSRRRRAARSRAATRSPMAKAARVARRLSEPRVGDLHLILGAHRLPEPRAARSSRAGRSRADRRASSPAPRGSSRWPPRGGRWPRSGVARPPRRRAGTRRCRRHRADGVDLGHARRHREEVLVADHGGLGHAGGPRGIGEQGDVGRRPLAQQLLVAVPARARRASRPRASTSSRLTSIGSRYASSPRMSSTMIALEARQRRAGRRAPCRPAPDPRPGRSAPRCARG